MKLGVWYEVLMGFFDWLIEENHRPRKVTLTVMTRKLFIEVNSAVKKLIYLILWSYNKGEFCTC